MMRAVVGKFWDFRRVAQIWWRVYAVKESQSARGLNSWPGVLRDQHLPCSFQVAVASRVQVALGRRQWRESAGWTFM